MIFSMNLMLTNVASSSVSKKLRTGCVGGLESEMVIVHTAHTDWKKWAKKETNKDGSKTKGATNRLKPLRWLPGKLDCEYTQFLDPISTNIKTNETRKMWGTSQMIIFAMWVRAACPLSKVAAACLDDANDANPLFGPEHHFTSRLLRTTSSSQIVCINVHNMSYEHIYKHLQTLTYDAVSDVVESGGQWRSNFHKVLKNC